MEKKELAERIVEYASNYHWNLEGWGDNVPEDDDLEKELTGIVTFVFEELDKAKIEVLTEIFQTCYQEDSKTLELVEEKLSKLNKKK